MDADEYLNLMDELAELEKELRSLGSKGFKSVKTTRPANKLSENDKPAMGVDLDISGIEWLTKDRQPADPSDGWAWAFAYTQNGEVKRETMQLLQAVEQYGSVRVGKFEIKLAGRDGNLLNRRKI